MEKPRETQTTLRYAGLATQWLVMLLIAVWGGIKIDAWLKWNAPVFTILLPVVSLTLSLYKLIKEVSKPKQ